MSGSRLRELEVASAVWNAKKLWVVHLIANAALLLLAYEWLTIPDRTILYLAFSALLALAIVALALWLHATTLAYFKAVHAAQSPQLLATFVRTARKLVAVIVWATVALASVWVVLSIGAYLASHAVLTASWLTLHLRRPVAPVLISTLFVWIDELLFFVVVLAVLFPLGADLALDGFRGVSWKSLKAMKHLRYWAYFPLFFVFGFLIPESLISWIPELNGLYAETSSVVLRFSIAYFLAVTSWLLLVSSVGYWSRPE